MGNPHGDLVRIPHENSWDNLAFNRGLKFQGMLELPNFCLGDILTLRGSRRAQKVPETSCKRLVIENGSLLLETILSRPSARPSWTEINSSSANSHRRQPFMQGNLRARHIVSCREAGYFLFVCLDHAQVVASNELPLLVWPSSVSSPTCATN